jgi:sialic acid synthase SpsE
VVRIEDVLIVRPEGKMGADEIDLVIGKSLKSGIRKHAGFTQEVLK